MQEASSKSADDRTLAGATYLGLATATSTLVFALLVMLTEQAGVPRHYGFVLTGLFAGSAIAVQAIQARTMSAADWMVAGRRAGTMINGMALAASVVTGWTLAMIGGQFFAGSATAAAWVAGPLLGLAVASFLILPYLRKSGAVTPAEFVALRFDSRLVGFAFAAAVIACGILLLLSQLRVAGATAAMLFPLERQSATIAIAAVSALALLPGGLRAMIRVNATIFALLATAYLAPLIWLSTSLTGNPVPQLSFGYGALGDIAAIEEQLHSLGIPELGRQSDGASLSAVSPLAAMSVGLFLAAGLCAMPFVLSHAPAAGKARQTRKTAGWAILLVAMVLTAAPALAAFAKLGLYNNLLGLTAGDVAAGADWLLAWGGKRSIADASPMAMLCGQAVTEPSAALTACGGNPDYVIGPADVRISAETVTFAFARVIGLPAVFGALIGTAVLGAAIAGLNAVAFSIASTVSRDMLVSRTLNRVGSYGSALFAARLALVAALASAAWLALRFEPDPLETGLWALAIGASLLAPALVGAIWWDRMSRWGALAGIAVAALALALHAGAALLGKDLQSDSGDEFLAAIPGLEALPAAFHAAGLALPASILAIALVSLLSRRGVDRQRLDAFRLPDAEPAVRGPEV